MRKNVSILQKEKTLLSTVSRHSPQIGLTPIVTTKHDVMKYVENDEYFILFICHFPCPSPIEFTHQHPIKWIHQCIFKQRDIT